MINPNQVIEQVRQVIAHTQHIKDPNVCNLLAKWSAQKQDMCNKLLQGKLIYQYPQKISFHMDEGSKKDRYNCFIEEVVSLLNLGWSDPFVCYLESIGVEAFYNNCLESGYTTVDGKRIQAGSKVIKSFKYFIKEKRALEELQNKASEIIQEDKIEGYLCFSIHPLDFLSSSENTYNWRSCHSLDGQYRAGNLSYMCDCSTMMVYLRAEEDVQLPHFPEGVKWNSKKWRCLFHWDDEFNLVFAGRQYPFFSPGALDVIRDIMIEENIGKISPSVWPWEGPENIPYSYWHNDYLGQFNYAEHNEEDRGYIDTDGHAYAIIQHQIYDLYDNIIDIPSVPNGPHLHYNDLLRSSCYTEPYYMFVKKWSADPGQLHVGSEVKCLQCGKNNIKSLDTMRCPDCEIAYGDSEDENQYPTCDRCGARFYAVEGSWVNEDDYVCAHCAEIETFICESCNERHYNEDKVYNKQVNQFWCTDCFEEVE